MKRSKIDIALTRDQRALIDTLAQERGCTPGQFFLALAALALETTPDCEHDRLTLRRVYRRCVLGGAMPRIAAGWRYAARLPAARGGVQAKRVAELLAFDLTAEQAAFFKAIGRPLTADPARFVFALAALELETEPDDYLDRESLGEVLDRIVISGGLPDVAEGWQQCLAGHKWTRRRICIHFTADEVLEHALAGLSGATVNNHRGQPDHRFGDMGTRSRSLAIFLEEAVYALEEFAAVHGYIPRQPRFEVVLGEDRKPEAPRRLERLREIDAIEAALAAATKRATAQSEPRP